MKRILLLGIILAICILAMPQGVLALTTGDVAVSATISDFVALQVSGPVSWTLDYANYPSYVNTKPAAITLTPDANHNWKITVYGTNGGKFNDPTAGTLTHVLKIQQSASDSDFGDVAANSGTALQIALGGIGNTPITRSLQQQLDITHDLPSTSGYTETLTFDIAVTS